MNVTYCQCESPDIMIIDVQRACRKCGNAWDENHSKPEQPSADAGPPKQKITVTGTIKTVAEANMCVANARVDLRRLEMLSTSLSTESLIKKELDPASAEFLIRNYGFPEDLNTKFIHWKKAVEAHASQIRGYIHKVEAWKEWRLKNPFRDARPKKLQRQTGDLPPV